MPETEDPPLTATLDWRDAPDVDVTPANVTVVLGLGDEVIIAFGHVVPPVVTVVMTPEQAQAHLDKNPVHVKRISRVALPVSAAKSLAVQLNKKLGWYEQNVESVPVPVIPPPPGAES